MVAGREVEGTKAGADASRAAVLVGGGGCGVLAALLLAVVGGRGSWRNWQEAPRRQPFLVLKKRQRRAGRGSFPATSADEDDDADAAAAAAADGAAAAWSEEVGCGPAGAEAGVAEVAAGLLAAPALMPIPRVGRVVEVSGGGGGAAACAALS